MNPVYDNEYMMRVGNELIEHYGLDKLTQTDRDGDKAYFVGFKGDERYDLLYRIEAGGLFRKVNGIYKIEDVMFMIMPTKFED